MFDTTTRRAQRDAQVRGRLERLIEEARAERADRTEELPSDQAWIEVPPARPGPVPGQAEAPDPVERATSGPAEDVDPAPAAGGDPWWRRGRAGLLIERWMPGGAVAARRRVPIVLIAGLVLGGAVLAGIALTAPGEREPPPGLPVAAGSETAVAPSRPPGGGTIVVSVVGRVVRPGLVTLADGARVADALHAAGGPAPGVDVSGLNIARRLTDGEQIYVDIPQPPDARPAGPGADGTGKVDLNTASVAQLDTLPGVGAVTAQRIVDWRTRHGRFTRVEQLREVDGIGPARFGQLKDLVVVR